MDRDLIDRPPLRQIKISGTSPFLFSSLPLQRAASEEITIFRAPEVRFAPKQSQAARTFLLQQSSSFHPKSLGEGFKIPVGKKLWHQHVLRWILELPACAYSIIFSVPRVS
ncbi:hypothetical protein E4T56_gene18196 [Termitomyces sp. T112]|nr:hypothetical protein E4T56_gene18196 [Termitomyces sp. T112]